MEKFTKIALLLDIYGNLIKGRRKEVLNLHYNEDYSLTEIAEIYGITKQGVRDFLVKGEKELQTYESALGILKEKFYLDNKIHEILQLNDIDIIKNEIKQLIYYTGE